jgi:predicted secreted protein
MNFTLYFFTFCFIWWLIFFISLPIGLKIEKNVQKGHADSAPINPRIMLKIAATTIITLLLLVILIYLVENGYLDHLTSMIKTYDRSY